MTKLAHSQGLSSTGGNDLATRSYVQGYNQQVAVGDYLVAALSTTQVDIADDAAVAFDTTLEQRGNLSVSSGTISGLQAGHTYVIMASLKVEHTATLYAVYKITDATTSTDLCQWELRSPSLSDNNSNASLGTYLYTPTQDTEIEIRNGSGDTALHDVSGGSQSRVIVYEVGATVVEAVGGLEFVDIIEVGGDTTSVSFGAGGDGTYGRSLDGDVDENYVVDYYFAQTTAGCEMEIRPNGATTDLASARHYGGASTSEFTYTKWTLFDSSTARSGSGSLEMKAKTGMPRTYLALNALGPIPENAADTFTEHYGGFWDETATNITSLDIVSDTASQIKAGSKFVLWRKRATPYMALNADTNERRFESAVEVGTDTTEQTSGHTNFVGSVVGLSARIEEAVTSGSVTCNLKVDGVTTLSVVLDTSNPTSARVTSSQGVYSFIPDKNVSLEIVTSGYDNASSVTSGLTVVATLLNEAFVQPPTDFKDTSNVYTKAQVVSPYGLSYGANIAVDASQSNVFTVTLTSTTAQLDNPTNLQDGHTLVFRVTQDGTGGRALTFGTAYDFGDEGAPDLTTEAAGALSIVTCMSDGTKLFCTVLKGFTA